MALRRFGLAAVLLLAGAALATADAPARAATLHEIKKEHNVDLGGGRLAVRLSVPADLSGSKGDTIGMDVWFHDDQGRLVLSVLRGYADADGNLHVASRTTTVASDPDAVEFVFLVPYGAFPARASGKYQVEARATLALRGAAAGTQTVLGTKTTTFSVE